MSSESDRESGGESSPSTQATDDPADRSGPLLAFADALLSSSQREPGRASGQVQQYVTFFLRDDEIGIPILQCREIVRALAITRVPEAPEHVRGVLNLRGRVLPAMDTRKCLGYETAPPTSRSRLLVVEVAGRAFALLVDRVARILKVAAADIASPPANARIRDAIGVARDGAATIYLTDAERILRPGTAAAAPTPKE
jgi:purine-binding chemotaxis protein CheW